MNAMKKCRPVNSHGFFMSFEVFPPISRIFFVANPLISDILYMFIVEINLLIVLWLLFFTINLTDFILTG